MKYKVEYTDEQNAIRLMDMEIVKDLLARRAYLLSGGSRAEELEKLWVREPENQATASYGENWGYIVGMDSLKEKYAGRPEEALDIGYGAVHSVNTGHVVIAYDGATARGLFYDVYERTVRKDDGSCETTVVCGPLACDFLKENGSWKIWHLFQGADHVFNVGEDYGTVPIPRPVESNPIAQAFGDPDIAMRCYDPDYGWADNYPAMPDPYYSYSPFESYAPEGHPEYVKEVSFR